MSDLIKREDVLKQIWEWVTDREFNYTNATHWLQKRIEAIPTIDAVEVVRCQDCKYWVYNFNGCSRNPCTEPWYATDFCNYGEREGE